jgi:hypothetical protein
LAEDQLKGLRQSADPDALDLLTEEERALLRPLGERVLMTSLDGSFSYASARELARKDAQTSGDHGELAEAFADLLAGRVPRHLEHEIVVVARHRIRKRPVVSLS